MGRDPFDQNVQKLRNEQKFPNTFAFGRTANHLTEISGNSGKEIIINRTEIFGKNRFENLKGYPLFSKIPVKPKIIVRFTAKMFRNSNRNFRSNSSRLWYRHQNESKQKGHFKSMVNEISLHCSMSCSK